MRFHKLNHQRLRKIRKLVTDTYTTNQEFMFRIAECRMHDSFPKQEQRHWFLLVFFGDKSTAHFYGLAHHIIQFRLKSEKLLKVKSVNSIFRENLRTKSHAVGTCNFFGIIVP